MKKLILIITLFAAIAGTKAQTPWDSFSYEFFFQDSITKQFKPNFNVEFWLVHIRDTGSANSPAATLDSTAIFGLTKRGDTVICQLVRTADNEIVPVATYDYAALPSLTDSFVPYQSFYVNAPADLAAIWGVRLNRDFITTRRSWISFGATRKIY